MRKEWAWMGLLAAFLVVIWPVAATSGPSGTITLYTSESEDDVNLIVQDFVRRHPGVNVRIFRAGSGPVVAKLQAELQAGRIQADVIWFADIAFFRELARRDLLVPYAPPAGRRVPSRYHYDGHRYHEVRLIFNVVAFNTNQVRFRPTSWWDLTLPRYRGRAGIPNPFVSGAAFAHVGTFASLREFGWGFYRRLRENETQVLRSNGDVLQKLASGEISIAQVVDFFVRAAKAQGSPLGDPGATGAHAPDSGGGRPGAGPHRIYTTVLNFDLQDNLRVAAAMSVWLVALALGGLVAQRRLLRVESRYAVVTGQHPAALRDGVLGCSEGRAGLAQQSSLGGCGRDRDGRPFRCGGVPG